MKNLKQRILANETLHGCFLNLGSHVTAEILGNSGFDWALIDQEHGAGNEGMMYHQLQAVEGTPAAGIVRVEELSRLKAQRILDAGAEGIMFPQIRTAEEAALAARSMYYPPKGIRGMAKMVRAHKFGKITNEYITNQEKNLVCIIQIETIEAIKNIDAIAATQNADVLFVGPSDLSAALGIFGKFQQAEYQDAIRNVAAAAKKYNKALGVLLQDIGEYEMYHDLGFRFLASGADGAFVARGAEAMAKMMKEKLR